MSEINMRDYLKMVMETEPCSLRTLQEMTGVSFATLSRFMRGKDIDLKTWRKLDAFMKGGPKLIELEQQTRRFHVGGKTFVITIKESDDQAS
jgi:hypothetical protein